MKRSFYYLMMIGKRIKRTIVHISMAMISCNQNLTGLTEGIQGPNIQCTLGVTIVKTETAKTFEVYIAVYLF